MKILEAKEEIIDVGPREPPSLKVEKTPSLGSEENAEAKNVLANGVAVLNGEEHQLRRIENGGEKKRKTSAASSSTCGTQGTHAAMLIWPRNISPFSFNVTNVSDFKPIKRLREFRA